MLAWALAHAGKVARYRQMIEVVPGGHAWWTGALSLRGNWRFWLASSTDATWRSSRTASTGLRTAARSLLLSPPSDEWVPKRPLDNIKSDPVLIHEGLNTTYKLGSSVPSTIISVPRRCASPDDGQICMPRTERPRARNRARGEAWIGDRPLASRSDRASLLGVTRQLSFTRCQRPSCGPRWWPTKSPHPSG